MQPVIRLAGQYEAPLVSSIVRQAFRNVAVEFGLSPHTAPTHPSNCEPEWIARDMARGLRYQLLSVDDRAAACVGFEHAERETFSFKHLAVLPVHRRKGLGRYLVDLALSAARNEGAVLVRIGIVADHSVLRNWYARQGFADAERRRFPHLPFEVLYMTRRL